MHGQVLCLIWSWFGCILHSSSPPPPQEELVFFKGTEVSQGFWLCQSVAGWGRMAQITGGERQSGHRVTAQIRGLGWLSRNMSFTSGTFSFNSIRACLKSAQTVTTKQDTKHACDKAAGMVRDVTWHLSGTSQSDPDTVKNVTVLQLSSGQLEDCRECLRGSLGCFTLKPWGLGPLWR